MQKIGMWNSTEPTGATLTTSTMLTAAGNEWNPSSKDTKRNRILQKWVKYTLSTWVLVGLIPRVIIALTPKEGCKLSVDWANIALH